MITAPPKRSNGFEVSHYIQPGPRKKIAKDPIFCSVTCQGNHDYQPMFVPSFMPGYVTYVRFHVMAVFSMWNIRTPPTISLLKCQLRWILAVRRVLTEACNQLIAHPCDWYILPTNWPWQIIQMVGKYAIVPWILWVPWWFPSPMTLHDFQVQRGPAATTSPLEVLGTSKRHPPTFHWILVG